MSTEDFIYRASRRRVSALETLAAGLGLLALLTLAQWGLARQLERRNAELSALRPAEERAETALETALHLNALKQRDVEKTKTAMVALAQRQKLYYEGRLALSEERRLLEKQSELLITRLQLEADGRLKLMRGEQTSKEYAGAAPVCWGEKMPKAAVVTSKEFHASPERGTVELQAGKLLWTPPQTGPAARSSALGQYVIFTNTPLILHLPSKDLRAHEAYPHCCLALSPAVAKKVYDAVFIGARIAVKGRAAD